jgi:TonB-linked SusC/RagA family outer membrane protein
MPSNPMKHFLHGKFSGMLNYLLCVVMLQCFAVSFAVAGSDQAQHLSLEEIYIQISLKNIRLEDALIKIGNQTQFSFAYNGETLDKNKIVNLEFKSVSVATLLRTLSKEAGLQFQRVDSQIYIRKKRLLDAAVSEQFTQSATVDVHGTIRDERGEGLPGVNVVVKGTSVGTVSDANGKFQLQITDQNTVLVISSIGYLTQEVALGGQRSVTIDLRPDVKSLDELVVVGYGEQKRKELTGAVVSVPKSVLENNVMPTLDGLLGGSVAGLSATQTSGQPGSGSSIRIRGGTSVNAKNDPLYVIDGFIFYNDASANKTGLGAIESSIDPLSSINPADIESIEVLKDVSATAIYGSRGANGVIIVTTKKGTRGETNINYRYTLGVGQSARKLDLMNANQWARLQKDYFNNKGRYTDEQISQLGQGYNWQDAVLQTGLSENHELSISGGDDKTRYLISGNLVDQKGIVINSGFKRSNARINLERDLKPNLTVGLSTIFGKNTQSSLTTTEPVNYNSSPFSAGITNSLTYALFIPPVVPIHASGGGYNYSNPYEYAYFALGAKTTNPVSDLKNSVAQTISNTLMANFFARYQILEGLIAKVSVGTSVNNATQNFFAPSYTSLGLAEKGVGAVGNKRNEVLQTEYTLGYTKKLNDNHFIDVLAGYTYQQTQLGYATTIASRFTNEDLKHNNLADGAVRYPPVTGSSKARLNSLIGRVNYTLKQKYNLTATIRADNSSRFAEKYRWGYFPSIGLSWNVDEEEFLKNQNQLTSLKLRASTGLVGNQEIGDYEFAQTYTSGQYNGSASYSKNNLGNPNLRWETTMQHNLGVDASFFSNRLGLVADIYYKKTSDLLLNVPVNSSQGLIEQLVNVGHVTNKGVELGITATLIQGSGFNWAVAANIARNINTITDMGTTKQLQQGNSSQQILRVNNPLGSYYGLIFEGIVQTGDNVAELPKVGGSTPSPGDLKFADISGSNGEKDGVVDSYDRTIIGNSQPDFTYGLSTTLTYKNFDLFALFQGSQGAQLFNGLRRTLEQPNDSYNVLTSVLDSWTESNPSNYLPRITGTRPFAYIDSRYVENASYLKMKNLTLGYNIKLKGGQLKMRVFASANNLLRITSYKGYDPEVSSGLDIGSYPSARTFLAGVAISF